jgi:hypothetical protein
MFKVIYVDVYFLYCQWNFYSYRCDVSIDPGAGAYKMKQDTGVIEFGAVIILLFLTAFLSGAVLFTASIQKYFIRNTFNQKEMDNIRSMVFDITTEMQLLKNFEYDDINNSILQSLKIRYAPFYLNFQDISSGYHLDFLSDSDLKDARLSSFLFTAHNASRYIVMRNNRGLSTDIQPLRELIKPEAWDICVSYGWINISHIDSFAFRYVSEKFKTTQANKLFPIVNEFPLININMVNPDILSPLINRPAFGIEKPIEKMELLKERLLSKPVILADISSILGVPKSNSIFTYLGTKTTFWKIHLNIRKKLTVEIIIAAIPDKNNGDVQKITEYALIDWSALHE